MVFAKIPFGVTVLIALIVPTVQWWQMCHLWRLGHLALVAFVAIVAFVPFVSYHDVMIRVFMRLMIMIIIKIMIIFIIVIIIIYYSRYEGISENTFTLSTTLGLEFLKFPS